MKHLRAIVGAVMFGLLVGCSPSEEPSGEESSLQAVETPRLTPGQVQEMLSKVPELDEGLVQALAGACQQNSTNSCVNAGFGTCTAWSAYADCGTLSACNTAGCPIQYCDELGCFHERRGSQSQGSNRYRVCFNMTGLSCTEYQRLNSTVCGCGEF